ncbi:MAG: Excinuclease subunit, partial [Ilumatobacteraceae bacterium]|nr:Excinuclease subunit [Ilumatobacteraceae bacterium]
NADWVIDLGPGGGSNGGTIVAVGTPDTLARAMGSLTAPYLAARVDR